MTSARPVASAPADTAGYEGNHEDPAAGLAQRRAMTAAATEAARAVRAARREQLGGVLLDAAIGALEAIDRPYEAVVAGHHVTYPAGQIPASAVLQRTIAAGTAADAYRREAGVPTDGEGVLDLEEQPESGRPV